MTLSYLYDGAALTHNIAPSTVSLPSAAEDGEASFGSLVVEDPDADLVLLGHRPFVIEEDACAQPRLWTGWTTERGIGRAEAEGMFGDATARIHDVTIGDLNLLFGFRVISGTDGQRPEETGAQRMAWIMASDYLAGLIEDTGFITNLPSTMDASDYRGSYPGDVIRDIADRSYENNWFAFWDTVASAVGLWFGPLDEAVSDSTLRISNVVADIDSTTTFAPDPEARLGVTPTETYSEVMVIYGNDGSGRIFRSRASTATKYIRRGTQITRPWTGKATTASNQAEKFLDQHANEEDRISVTIIVPASKVGLLTAGQRLDVKFSHLTNYTTFTSMRCVRLTVTPTNDLATHYSMAMELLAPRPAAAAAPTAASFQSCTTSGWPVGAFWEMNLEAWNGSTWVEILTAAELSADENTEIAISPPVTATQWRLHMTLNWDTVFMYSLLHQYAYLKDGSGTDLLLGKTFVGSGPADGFSLEGWLASAPVGAYGTLTMDQSNRWTLNQTDIIANYVRTMHYYWTWDLGGAPDVEVVLPPPPGATITATTDPTVNDDAGDSYLPGQTWINTATPESFVLVDNTLGAAVWVSTTASGTVYAPTDVDYLVGTASGGLSAEIVVGTTPGGELGGTWASPTVDATHSGSAHLALGSTSSTAAAGDHAHAVTGVGAILISDTPSTPLVFADLIQNEAEDDLVYGDP